MAATDDAGGAGTARESQLVQQVAELKTRLQELEDTLGSINGGDVDALIVNGAVYTLESAQLASNRLRQDVLSQMEEAVFAFDNEENIIYVNAAAERRYGLVSSEVLGRHKSYAYAETAFNGLNRDDADTMRGVATHRLARGVTMHVESIVSVLNDAFGNAIGSLAVMRDVTQRLRAEVRRDALLGLSETLRDSVTPADIERAAAATVGQTLYASRVGYGAFDEPAESLFVEQDWTSGDAASLVGHLRLRECGSFVDDLKRNELVVISDVRLDPRTSEYSASLRAQNALALVNVPIVEQGHLVAVLFVSDAAPRDWSPEDVRFVQDVAERTRSATERARGAAALRTSEARLREVNEGLEAAIESRTRELMEAEQALRQAQKMEAVGQLTGGIAHDFNNLLATMSASLQVLRSRVNQGRFDGLDRYVTMGQDAIRRAAALTQRLLAFARRQTLDPKPTDVNRLIGNLEELLRRSVGPNVVIEVVGAGGLWSTRIDPSQLENSLLNLCINARDAMQPDGGRLTIETANKWLDERAAAERELSPGQYVSLCVSDTGCGMTPEVIKRVFDPFFTTKPLGQGTGLGLSMVYGFVRQSGGQIRIYSEVGKGTTMCLYLPRFVGQAEQDEAAGGVDAVEAGDGEAVLIIEDEETIRSLIAEVLEEAGYRTLTAADGAAGLRVLQSTARIDLLVTDVGLPGGMNGRQVADAARVARPQLKVLFITGYAENAAVGNGHLEHGMEILTKPFEIAALAKKVRTMTGA
jgi:PAS domain S-box-containing protein